MASREQGRGALLAAPTGLAVAEHRAALAAPAGGGSGPPFSAFRAQPRAAKAAVFCRTRWHQRADTSSPPAAGASPPPLSLAGPGRSHWASLPITGSHPSGFSLRLIPAILHLAEVPWPRGNGISSLNSGTDRGICKFHILLSWVVICEGE